jgi:hypothetical protein
MTRSTLLPRPGPAPRRGACAYAPPRRLRAARVRARQHEHQCLARRGASASRPMCPVWSLPRSSSHNNIPYTATARIRPLTYTTLTPTTQFARRSDPTAVSQPVAHSRVESALDSLRSLSLPLASPDLPQDTRRPQVLVSGGGEVCGVPPRRAGGVPSARVAWPSATRRACACADKQRTPLTHHAHATAHPHTHARSLALFHGRGAPARSLLGLPRLNLLSQLGVVD